MTHTYVELEVSQAAYDEVARKLKEAGYTHTFMEDGTIDMHGIGLVCAKPCELVVPPPGDDFLSNDLDRRLRTLKETLHSLHWHVVNNTVNKEVVVGLVEKALRVIQTEGKIGALMEPERK